MFQQSQIWAKRASLSEPSLSTAPPMMHIVVRDHAHGTAFDANQCRHDADAELGSQFQHRVVVSQQVDDLAHVVGAQPVLRNHVAQLALIGGAPFREPALEVGEVFLHCGHRFLFVLDEDVDDAVGHLLRHRPEFLGQEEAKATAFDDCGSAHGDVGSFGRDDDVAHTQH